MLAKRHRVFLHEACHDKIVAHLYQESHSSSVFTPARLSIRRRPPCALPFQNTHPPHLRTRDWIPA